VISETVEAMTRIDVTFLEFNTWRDEPAKFESLSPIRINYTFRAVRLIFPQYLDAFRLEHARTAANPMR
jgi:hypothetical protein